VSHSEQCRLPSSWYVAGNGWMVQARTLARVQHALLARRSHCRTAPPLWRLPENLLLFVEDAEREYRWVTLDCTQFRAHVAVRIPSTETRV